MVRAAPRPLYKRLGDRAIDLALATTFALLRPLPYATRLSLFGRVTAHVIAPLAGWPRRIRANLAHALPDLPPAEAERLVHRVPDHIGRSTLEFFSGPDVRARLDRATLEGDGVEALHAAMISGRATILVSGHIGNYTIFRALMAQRYGSLAALYQPMANAPFNRRYRVALEDNALPLFARDRAGMAAMLRHLQEGGALMLLHDQFIESGAPLAFFGKTTLTTLSPAELALRHGAPLIPFYAIRQPDGLSFRITVEQPVPHSDPATMMQALNTSLERQIRAHPEQWLWTHRRWRGDVDYG
ncbi:hypothetical protein ATO6_21665 [Oceanicola sp. 22II-s10i]|uniref:lysophospholipid acyltransferase family protein n=1 Tax=Oceanicola sp. 22II-s10i TaxID=1317116 RepID=UPI000B521396|nr:lauroyl acyltransferase [Oceanicola sp. 22II-s10i]OWU82908.1 hypothetical protein ATO6_21665 [Oceanicola sp. 22II-s10i]